MVCVGCGERDAEPGDRFCRECQTEMSRSVTLVAFVLFVGVVVCGLVAAFVLPVLERWTGQ